MSFNDLLSEIMMKHNIRAVDICNKSGLKRSYLSKVLSGSLVPSSYGIVEKIIDSFDFTIDEKDMLADAYQMSVSSDERKRLWSSFRQSYTLKLPKAAEENASEYERPENGAVLTDNNYIGFVLRDMLSKSSDKVCMYFCAVSAEVSERFAACMNSFSGDSSIAWIMPMNTSASDDNMNYSLMINSFPMACARNVTVFKTEEDIGVLLNSVFPFYLFTDTELVLFDENLSRAEYISDPGLVSLYKENFAQRQQKAVLFMNSFDRAETALKYLSEEMFSSDDSPESEYYTLSNVPCIIFDISTSDVQKYTIEQNEQSHDFAQMYLNFMANVAKTSSRIIDVFSSYGLIDYLDKEEWYELGKHFSKNMPRDYRRKMVRSSVEYAKNSPSFSSQTIKLPGFNKNAFVGLNLWTSGYMILVYDFEEKSVVITAKDKGIAGSFISYLKALEKHGIIASQEETAEYISRVLDERK